VTLYHCAKGTEKWKAISQGELINQNNLCIPGSAASWAMLTLIVPTSLTSVRQDVSTLLQAACILDVPVYLCICVFRSVRVQRSFEKQAPQLELFWSSVDVQRRPLNVWYNTT
jgi:hypothetical protein